MAHGRRRAEPVVDDLESDRAGPDEAAATGQLDAGMQGALMALTLDYRTLVVLKHLQDCSYEEIATILECPVKTVKSRLFTARQALRDVLLSRGLI